MINRSLFPVQGEECSFFDAVEDIDDLSDDEELAMSPSSNPVIMQMKSALTDVHRRRAQARNKLVSGGG